MYERFRGRAHENYTVDEPAAVKTKQSTVGASAGARIKQAVIPLNLHADAAKNSVDAPSIKF